jgi:hypothetical protein
MWHPSRSQWIVIWTTFVVALYCFFWGNRARWTASDLLEPVEYRTLGWFALGGGALGVWFLQGRRGASQLADGQVTSHVSLEHRWIPREPSPREQSRSFNSRSNRVQRSSLWLHASPRYGRY